MSERPVYLDHNATTPILDEVVDAMIPYLREHFGNPSSGHAAGARAREAVDEARERVGALLGASAHEILFTSGGTEASNLGIVGSLQARGCGGDVVVSGIEHPATSAPCALLRERGRVVHVLEVDARGVVDLERAAEVPFERVALVSVMHANNETGVLQPIRALSERARAHGALVHTDAAQSVGKVPVDVDALGVDLLTVAGHKLYAPKGVGALYVREGTPLEPVLRGAGHERGLRPGTENVASIVGLGVAAEAAARGLAERAARVARLRDALFGRLAAQIPGLVVHGEGAERLPNTLSVRFPGVLGPTLLERAPEVQASTGSACHEGGGATASAVVLAMGVDPTDALGTVRLTLGRHTTADEVERAARALTRAWRALT